MSHGLAGLGISRGLSASPRVNRNPPRSPHPANRRGREGRGRGLEPSLSPRVPAGTAVRVRFGREDDSQVLHVPKRRWCLWVNLSSPFRINSFASVSAPSNTFVSLGEPNYFSPNPASPVVDAIGLPAFAIASPDIPNSAIHFRTILFSPSGLGESLWLAR